MQTGTLGGNISIKKKYPEFPSDVFITFEALDVQIVVGEDSTTQRTVSLQEYLSLTNKTLIIIAFELKPYPKANFYFDSYKVRILVCIIPCPIVIFNDFFYAIIFWSIEF